MPKTSICDVAFLNAIELVIYKTNDKLCQIQPVEINLSKLKIVRTVIFQNRIIFEMC